MRAGENRGILSRVLTIYKQTFIFQIFCLFFFWKLKPLCPFRPVLRVGNSVMLPGTPVGTQAGWAGSEDLTSSKGSPRTGEGHELLPFQEKSPGKCEDPWTDPRGIVPHLQRSFFQSKANYCFGQQAGLCPPLPGICSCNTSAIRDLFSGYSLLQHLSQPRYLMSFLLLSPGKFLEPPLISPPEDEGKVNVTRPQRHSNGTVTLQCGAHRELKQVGISFPCLLSLSCSLGQDFWRREHRLSWDNHSSSAESKPGFVFCAAPELFLGGGASAREAVASPLPV